MAQGEGLAPPGAPAKYSGRGVHKPARLKSARFRSKSTSEVPRAKSAGAANALPRLPREGGAGGGRPRAQSARVRSQKAPNPLPVRPVAARPQRSQSPLQRSTSLNLSRPLRMGHTMNSFLARRRPAVMAKAEKSVHAMTLTSEEQLQRFIHEKQRRAAARKVWLQDKREEEQRAKQLEEKRKQAALNEAKKANPRLTLSDRERRRVANDSFNNWIARKATEKEQRALARTTVYAPPTTHSPLLLLCVAPFPSRPPRPPPPRTLLQ